MKLLSPSMSIGIARVSPLLYPTFTSNSSHAKLFCRYTKPCKFAFSSAARVYPYSAKRAVNVRSDYGDDGGFAAPSKFPRPESVPWQKELANTVHLIGYVGKPVEMRYAQTGKAFAWTSLGVKTSKGEETTWFTLNFWEELAEIAAEHLKARDQVYVSGSLHVDKVEGKDNNIRTFFQIWVKSLNFVERGCALPQSGVVNMDDSLDNQEVEVKFSTSGKNASTNAASTEKLWQTFFANPDEWWDNRENKRNPKGPDFKHKDTGEVLWIESFKNPSWVKSQLDVLDERRKVSQQFTVSKRSLSSFQERDFLF